MSQLPDPDDVEPATADERLEIETIRRFFCSGGDLQKAYSILDAQLGLLHTRALALVQVAGVVITVTGFSGRIIADTNNLAQVLIILGLTLVVTAAAISIGYVMPIRWMTTYMHLPNESWMVVAIRRRNRKNRAFRIAIFCLLLGLIIYLGAIGIMLGNPEAAELRRVR